MNSEHYDIVKLNETNRIAAHSATQNTAHKKEFSAPVNSVYINSQSRAISHVAIQLLLLPVTPDTFL